MSFATARALDPAQRRVVGAEPSRSLLVLGAAGSGKTTAALHRLAAVARAVGPDLRALVLVPTPGLAARCRRAVAAARLPAEVHPLDAWLGRQARRAFGGLDPRDSEDVPPAVPRVKRHPAVADVLALLDPQVPDDTVRDDLYELWGDASLLAELADAADGALSEADLARVRAHAEVQFAPVERDDDGRPLRGMDGVPLHHGTALNDALTLDVEDYPLLFALDRLRGGRRRPTRYHHVVLDEAQELAPLELALLGRAVGRGGALTVVGDAGQQIDPTAWFAGWEASLAALGRPADRLTLTASHRCPPAVLALAQAIRDRRPAPDGVVRVLAASAADHDDALAAWLAPGPAPTAVVAADATLACALHASLPRALGARLAVGRGEVDAPLVVTSADRLRGLDLARVAVPELDPARWPDTAEARGALYVAVTRAAREVWLGSVGRWSPLLG
ncbi:MAG: AAA family ATPase [Myxococcota bacterium]